MPYRLLFVEDDKGQVNALKDALSDWNAANPDKVFSLDFATNYDDAVTTLANSRFDGALLDLRLPGGGKLPGQELADLCVVQYGMPAAIISGEPADYDKRRGNGILEVFNKGDKDPYKSVVEWFGALWPMMRVLDRTRSTIQKTGAEVFSKRVWPRWKSYEKLLGEIDETQLTAIVTRQYTSHIADLLGIDSADNVKWHPIENYVLPALQEARPHTGDLFRFNGQLWIILTPQCDMATKKASSVLLASCDPRPDLGEWKGMVGFLQGDAQGKKKIAESYFRKLINQLEAAVHFLPPLDDGQPLMVDFKKLMTLPLDEVQRKLSDRVASVATPFLANLTQRFGAYISRIGQPDIDVGHFS